VARTLPPRDRTPAATVSLREGATGGPPRHTPTGLPL
jgi:hypothetical protein